MNIFGMEMKEDIFWQVREACVSQEKMVVWALSVFMTPFYATLLNIGLYFKKWNNIWAKFMMTKYFPNMDQCMFKVT